MEHRVILLHGFENEDLVAAVRTIKAALPDGAGIAFASTTPINVEWKVGELLEHVSEEHEAFRKGRTQPR